MPNQSLIVLDNYYADPDAVRRLALEQKYERAAGASYPGREAVARDRNWSETRQDLRRHISDSVDAPCPKKPVFPQGKFRIAFGVDQETRTDGVHVDLQPWSGVIYLSRPEDCRGHGAIGFYRNKRTGADRVTPQFERVVLRPWQNLSPEAFRDKWWEYSRDPDEWEEVQRLENRFNRAVLLQAHCFHASIGVFGDSMDTGRLTQHFEYYSGTP